MVKCQYHHTFEKSTVRHNPNI